MQELHVLWYAEKNLDRNIIYWKLSFNAFKSVMLRLMLSKITQIISYKQNKKLNPQCP